MTAHHTPSRMGERITKHRMSHERDTIHDRELGKRFRTYATYKDSGIAWLGAIPSHWRVTRLKRVCTFEYGDSLPSENRIHGDVPVYGSNGPVGTHECANALGPHVL